MVAIVVVIKIYIILGGIETIELVLLVLIRILGRVAGLGKGVSDEIRDEAGEVRHGGWKAVCEVR